LDKGNILEFDNDFYKRKYEELLREKRESKSGLLIFAAVVAGMVFGSIVVSAYERYEQQRQVEMALHAFTKAVQGFDDFLPAAPVKPVRSIQPVSPTYVEPPRALTGLEIARSISRKYGNRLACISSTDRSRGGCACYVDGEPLARLENIERGARELCFFMIDHDLVAH